MKKVVFAESWREVFAESGLELFDDFFGYDGGRVIGKNNKRDVIEFGLGEEGQRRVFFMKRFLDPHCKDILSAWREFGRPASQAELEWSNARVLLGLGIDTYRPVCFGVRSRCGIERNSFFVTEEIKGRCLTDFAASEWSGLEQSQKEEIVTSLGRFIRKIHDAGVSLPDLYLWHIYVKESGTCDQWDFAVIDLHRMKGVVTSRNRQLKNLGRLDHSMLDKYFDQGLRRLFVESYAGSDRPGDIERLAAKVKKYSDAVSARRNPKPY